MFSSHYSNKNISPTRTKIMTKNEFVPFFLLSKSRPNITNLSFWRSYWPEGKWVTIKMSFLGSAFHHQFHWVSLWRERQELLLLFSLFNIPALQPILQVFCSLGLGFHLICFPSCHVLRLPLLCLYVSFPLLMLWGMAPCQVVRSPHRSLHWPSHPDGKSSFPLTHAILCYVDLRANCPVLSKARGVLKRQCFSISNPQISDVSLGSKGSIH